MILLRSLRDKAIDTIVSILGVKTYAHQFIANIEGKQRVQLETTYRQLEAYLSLLHSVNPRRPLPPMRGSAISPDFSLILQREVQRRKPNLILECGCGVSTVILSYCLEKNAKGHLYSLEHDEKYANSTQRYLEEHGLERWATIAHAPLKSYTIGNKEYTWYDLERIKGFEKIEMLVIDGPTAVRDQNARYPALLLLSDRLSGDAMMLLDDAARPGEKHIIAAWLEEFDGWSCETYETEKGSAILRRS